MHLICHHDMFKMRNTSTTHKIFFINYYHFLYP